MDSMTMAMSPYASRYARVAPGGMRRSNVNPAQAPLAATAPSGPAGPAPAGLQPSYPPSMSVATTPGAAPGVGTPAAPYNPLSLDSNISKFQNAESGAVQGYGDMVGQDFQKSVGNLLGNLNEIGGLRSGGVTTGVNDIMTNYGRQIGDYAKMTAADATHAGQEEFDAATERQYRTDAEKRARKNSLISGIGSVLGGAAGAYFGGTAGAGVGAKIGGAL